MPATRRRPGPSRPRSARRPRRPAGAARRPRSPAIRDLPPALAVELEPEPDDPPTAPIRRPATRAERDGFQAATVPYQRELYAAALRYTRSRADADDLVQDTLMRALAAWPSFIPGSNCRAWLHRILTNSFISGYRRRRRHHRFTTETGDDAARALYASELDRATDPRARVGADALGDEVLAALAELNADYRAVVELADLEGIRYRDIATRLGLPIGTVMSRLFRARRQLEARLEPYAAACGISRAA